MNAARACGSCASTDVYLYAEGWRCADHTPAKAAGHPEPDSARYCAPARCYCGDCGPLGSWVQCAECQRRYRPVSLTGLCYDCQAPQPGRQNDAEMVSPR